MRHTALGVVYTLWAVLRNSCSGSRVINSERFSLPTCILDTWSWGLCIFDITNLIVLAEEQFLSWWSRVFFQILLKFYTNNATKQHWTRPIFGYNTYWMLIIPLFIWGFKKNFVFSGSYLICVVSVACRHCSITVCRPSAVITGLLLVPDVPQRQV